MPGRAKTQCIFCGGGGVAGNKISDEHVWSTWMRKLLPPGDQYVEYKRTIRRKTGETTEFRRTRNGGANTKKLKVVCETCNNGWMSLHEGRSGPILTALIKGDCIVLDPSQQRILAEWVLLKLFVIEHNGYADHPPDPIFPQEARAEFKEARAIPDGVEIRIGMQEAKDWVTGLYRFATGIGFTTTLPPAPSPGHGTKNAQTLTWGLGKLVVHVSVLLDPEVRSMVGLDRTGPLVKLWPMTGATILWPPSFFTNDLYLNDLASALERYVASPALVRVD